jgi:phosphatidylglycerophosphatase A
MAFRLIKEKGPENEDVKVSFWIKILGSGFGTGYFPIASGTVGSFLAMLVYLIPQFSGWLYLSASIVLSFLIGLYVSEKMRLRYGEDPYIVTIDEISGQWLTYLVGSVVFELFFKYKPFDVDFQFLAKAAFAVVGFFVFRFFDIVKLEPAKYFDNKDTGWGIMMDDIVSGVYAGVVSAVLTHFIWFKLLQNMI